MYNGLMKRRGTHILLIIGIIFTLFQNLEASPSSREICAQKYRQIFDSFSPRDPQFFAIKAGIEIEGSFPKKIGLKKLAQQIRSKLNKDLPQIKVELSYDDFEDIFIIRYKKKNNKVMTWTIKEDPTVGTEEIPLEITSPILEEPEDYESFKKVIQLVKDAGAQSEPSTGGVHVHVNFNHQDGPELAALAGIFSEIEEEVKQLFSVMPTRNDHIKPTGRLLLRTIKETKNPNDASFLYNLINSQSRNHALNLQSLRRFQTVEFRLFNSTFDIEALELMSDFATKVVEAVRQKNPQLIQFLTESDEPITLSRVANILEMKIAHPDAEKVLGKIFQESQKNKSNWTDDNHQGEPSLHRLAILLGCAALVQSMNDSTEKWMDS